MRSMVISGLCKSLLLYDGAGVNGKRQNDYFPKNSRFFSLFFSPFSKKTQKNRRQNVVVLFLLFFQYRQTLFSTVHTCTIVALTKNIV